MKATTNTPQKALNQAYRKEKVTRQEIDLLKRELPLLLDRIANTNESEENHKGHFQDFLKEVWYKNADCLVAPKGRIDLVIHDGPKAKEPVGVMIEAKRKANKAEMFSAAKPNVKSLHELVLYFIRERNEGNTAIKTLMITDADETYLFPDREFERLFWEKKRFRNKVIAADADTGKTNNTVYEIIKRHIEELDDTLHGTTFTISQFRKWVDDGDPETDDNLTPLYKILSPPHLLRRPFANDSNKLDKGFYRELLHIIGLEEVGVDSKGREKKNGGKKIIRRATGPNRHPASLLENTLQIAGRDNRLDKAPDFRAYGNDLEERRFGAALELCTTWVNRVLFLKLLESQLVAYHAEGPKTQKTDRTTSTRFLTNELVQDYDALNTLFIDVLNTKPAARANHVQNFAHVPYLNSSLFEISPLEAVTLQVSFLKDQYELPLAPQSILRTRARAQKEDVPETMKPLEYLFAFLDAYDFSSEGKARIQEENKRLINASVLGLIFEKINGYRDGSFYTPGFITEYMCRETIRRAVVQKFKDNDGLFARFDSDSFADLTNYLAGTYKAEERLAANQLVNSITVCDPAVGSGHFLVSALNELIATKSELGILGADAGAKKVDIKATVVNDELIVSDQHGEPYEYHVRTDANGQIRADDLTQTIQETIFHEKRTLIENCLFGVDLNPNSVKICRLRLWIELLKNAYYIRPSAQKRSANPGGTAAHLPPSEGRGRLETLPNIDINIKQGNSLISRFALNDDLSGALKDSGLTLADYRQAVVDYHRATGKEAKDKLLQLIDSVKGNFRTHISRNDPKRKDLANARGKRDQSLNDIAAAERFGIEDARVKKVRKALLSQEKQVAKLEAEFVETENNKIYEQAFEWRFEFPSVLDAEGTFVGFDVVVGNPPYGVKFSSSEKAFFKNNFKTIVGKYDSYGFFIELSINILNKSGNLNYIVPHTWLTINEAKTLRRHVLESGNIRQFYRLNTNVFDEATVDTVIFDFQSSSKATFLKNIEIKILPLNTANSEVDLYIHPSYCHSREYYIREDKFNILLEPDEVGVLEKTKTFQNLEENVDFSVGIQAYDSYAGQSKEIIASRAYHSKEKKDESFKRELNGKDVSRYKILYPGESYVSYGDWLAHPRDEKYFKGTRILVREITNKPPYMIHAALTSEDFINYKSILNIIPLRKEQNMWSILGLLNSKFISWIYLKSSNKLATNTFPRISLHDLKRLRFPSNIPSKIGELANRIQTSPTADTTALEAEIDVLVYRLYGLTWAEVKVVDPEFGLTAEAYEAG